MIEIIINHDDSVAKNVSNDPKIEEFKVERVYEWDDTKKENRLVHKTFISFSGINASVAKDVKDKLKGDSKSRAFGRFDFEGSVSFQIDGFYATLYNISLSDFRFEKTTNRLKINFTPLDGFGYLSGMGINVLRDQKLEQILNF